MASGDRRPLVSSACFCGMFIKAIYLSVCRSMRYGKRGDTQDHLRHSPFHRQSLTLLRPEGSLTSLSHQASRRASKLSCHLERSVYRYWPTWAVSLANEAHGMGQFAIPGEISLDPRVSAAESAPFPRIKYKPVQTKHGRRAYFYTSFWIYLTYL